MPLRNRLRLRLWFSFFRLELFLILLHSPSCPLHFLKFGFSSLLLFQLLDLLALDLLVVLPHELLALGLLVVLLVPHEDVPLAELALPRAGAAEVDVLEEVIKVDHLLAEAAELGLLIAGLLMVAELVLHGLEGTELTGDLDVLLLLVLLPLGLADDLPALALVHVPEAVGLVQHELGLLDGLPAVAALLRLHWISAFVHIYFQKEN
mmetsp:Transcript_23108/g.26493  ORF Transcript_23108/g.26493 Transcript_23108/m.26493 type:complete len:207 (+) Transcript_23108:283-903(+)